MKCKKCGAGMEVKETSMGAMVFCTKNGCNYVVPVHAAQSAPVMTQGEISDYRNYVWSQLNL